MPLILRNPVLEKGELAVWKINETPEMLLESLQSLGIYADIPFFRNPSRLAEWLTARLLLGTLGIKQKIVYSDAGKPYLDGENTHISISHSGKYVAIIAHPDYPTGVDIETVGDRIHRVSHKFVNDQERSWLNAGSETEQLYVIWGAKECAFKIFGLGEIDFREHLNVDPFEYAQSGVTKVHFKKGENHCIYEVFFQYLEQTMITYAFAT